MDTAHITPTDDLVEHTEDARCVCGPDVEIRGNVVVVTHHSLDGRELAEDE